MVQAGILCYGVCLRSFNNLRKESVVGGARENTIFPFIYIFNNHKHAWVFFYFTDLNKVFSFLGIMFGIGANGFVNVEDSMTILNNGLFIIIAAISCTPIVITLRKFIEKRLKAGNTRT